jgi:hypothetical protein
MSIQSGFGNQHTDLFICHFSSANEFWFHYTMMVESVLPVLNRNDSEISITFGASSHL